MIGSMNKMLNQVVLVGRLVKDPEIKELENGKKVCNITLAVPRSYKNSNGEYDTDFIECVLWNMVAESTKNYCKKGDVVGVKGRMQTREKEIEPEEGFTYTIKVVEIVAEKVTFLSSKGKDK